MRFVPVAVSCVAAALASFAGAPNARADSAAPAHPLGVTVEAGAPELVAVRLTVRPRAWLRLGAGPVTDLFSAGVSGGVTIVPLSSLVSPSVTVDGDYLFDGDTHGIPQKLGVPIGDGRAAYAFADGHVGLDRRQPPRLLLLARGRQLRRFDRARPGVRRRAPAGLEPVGQARVQRLLLGATMRLPVFTVFRLLAFVTMILQATGCVQIDADISGLSASAGNESFDGAGAAAGQTLTVAKMLTFDERSALASALQAARIDSVTLTPVSGVTSLAFLSSLTLILHADSGDVPLIDASGQGMTAADGADGSIVLPIAVDIDPTLLEQPITVATTLAFAAPADPWSMRIDAALTVRGHADLHP